jgi:hypothetical protein
MSDIDPYAQEKAVAAAFAAAEDRNERASVLAKLDEILALLKAQAKPSKKAAE